jgi:hypothetical protein
MCRSQWLRSVSEDTHRSHSAIAGSNPAGVMAVCFDCCVLSGRGPCDGHISSSRRELPSVSVCLSVISKPQQ